MTDIVWFFYHMAQIYDGSKKYSKSCLGMDILHCSIAFHYGWLIV